MRGRPFNAVAWHGRTIDESLESDIDMPIVSIAYPIDTVAFCPAVKPESTRAPLVRSIGRVDKRKIAHVLQQAIPSILASQPQHKFIFIGRLCNDIKQLLRGVPARHDDRRCYAADGTESLSGMTIFMIHLIRGVQT